MQHNGDLNFNLPNFLNEIIHLQLFETVLCRLGISKLELERIQPRSDCMDVQADWLSTGGKG